MFFPRLFRPQNTLVAMSLALALGAASSPVAATEPAAGAGRVRLVDSFRPVAPVGSAAEATRAENVRDTLTAAETAAPREVQLVLHMRNADELERRVTAGESISREEMAARFLPTAIDYQAVADWLTSQGLSVKPAGASHAVVIASGTTAQVEKTFETHFARVKYHGEEFTSATVAPSLPAEIQTRVSGIHGLQPHLRPRKHTPRKEVTTNPGTTPYHVADILKAYSISATGLTGAGQTIAIIIDTLPKTADLTYFWTNNSVAQNLNNYSTVDVEGTAIGAPTGEETLDVEWSSGIASGAKIVVYACNDLDNVNDAYSRLLDDLQSGAQPTLHQVSMSYGSGEVSDETTADMNSVHTLFTAISAYGVSLFASSGDEGAYGNDEGIYEALYPASDPLVTGVGGTTLYLNSADAVTGETGWSIPSGSNVHDSSGGGVSVVFNLPSYQTGTGVLPNRMRQVPDVSLNGDPNTGYYVIFDSRAEQDGGTSVSSPCWAGLCALANQGRASKGLPAITGLNAALYPLLGTSSFRDITSGNNGPYVCTTGYDLVTGLGVPNFSALYQKLLTEVTHPSFFRGEVALSNGVYYLAFPSGNYFGYYSYLSNPSYIYHFDLGYEYLFDAADGFNGIYLYDFASKTFFYSSPTYPFPYLYDFTLNSVLYYYPNTSSAGHYTTNPRYFYDFNTKKIITK